ncbi:MAG: DNA-directed RNA polymerase subunit omega [Alistipes sp.]|jgi:DNA-directed RNA polymerase subunit K/omega|nr:DNA-directed RNA polymerase subunit omega [Alistipes sp.]
METKKNIPGNTVTRKLADIDAPTGNVYESVAIISKRANQISSGLKEELKRKLEEFSTTGDSLEETFENREQIEISRFYERMPKATLIATEEFLGGELYFHENRPEPVAAELAVEAAPVDASIETER